MKSTPKLVLAGAIAGLALFVAGCTGGGAPPAPAASEPAADAAATTPPAAENPPPAAPSTPEPATPPPAKVATEKPKPAPKAAATPAPAPEPVMKTVAAGTPIELELIDGASSKTSQVGDVVAARVAKDVVVDGLVVLPAGTRVEGTVVEAVPLKKIGGQAKLGLEFKRAQPAAGEATAIDAAYAVEGEKQSGKDAAKIGGGAAAGALLGRVISKDKDKGTAIGAVVGAAAGTAAAAKTGQDNDVSFAAGSMIVVTLKAPVTVTVHR